MIPKQPLQHPWKEETLAPVTRHLLLRAGSKGEEVSLGESYLGLGGRLGF